MSPTFHVQIPPHGPRGGRVAAPAAGLVLILLLALAAAVWMIHPPVASLLPVHAPG